MICHRIDYANEKFQVHLRLYYIILNCKTFLRFLSIPEKICNSTFLIPYKA